MEHLQGMGDSNACIGRLPHVGKDVMLAAATVYQHAFGTEWVDDYENAESGSPEGGQEYPEEDDPEFGMKGVPEGKDVAATSRGSASGELTARNSSKKTTSEDGGDEDDPIPIPCTFQSIHMIGWKHHESQQKPLTRGSAQRSLTELGDTSSNRLENKE